jgi:hypothetical protein
MFAKAMSAVSYTWNGALSNSIPDTSKQNDGRISLFFKGIRGISENKINEYMEKSSTENLIDTIILAFYTRDPRGGKGERTLGRHLLTWMFKNHPESFSKVYRQIPEYGRWDDLLLFFPGTMTDLSTQQQEIQKNIVSMFSQQLYKDKKLMEHGKPISLCAKWAPTEGDSDDKKFKVVKTLSSDMGLSAKNYRKEYTTPLRSYLNIVETLMCSGRWSDIELGKVPSSAMKILKKAFEKHIPDEFLVWKSGLESGTTKVNAKVLHPHEIVREVRTKRYADEVAIAQWKILEEEVIKLGTLKDSICVVDTSSSMHTPNYLPFDIACAMGLIISSAVQGEFHNNVITFNDIPQFCLIKDGHIGERFEQIRSIPWGGSTNLEKTFKIILVKGKKAGLTDSQMPKRVFIISDMQFNSINGYVSPMTNFEAINQMYLDEGYTMPQIVFWNVNGSSNDFPVTIEDNGTVMVSGASPSILKAIINSASFDTLSIIRETLDSERYQPIKKLLLE